MNDAETLGETLPPDNKALIRMASAEAMRGSIVYGRDGDLLGSFDRMILDKRSGQIAYVVLSSGGFLGFGHSYHPIPWPAFRYDEKKDSYVLAFDKHLLEGAPSYRLEAEPAFDEIYGQRITDYFRLSLDGTA